MVLDCGHGHTVYALVCAFTSVFAMFCPWSWSCMRLCECVYMCVYVCMFVCNRHVCVNVRVRECVCVCVCTASVFDLECEEAGAPLSMIYINYDHFKVHVFACLVLSVSSHCPRPHTISASFSVDFDVSPVSASFSVDFDVFFWFVYYIKSITKHLMVVD